MGNTTTIIIAIIAFSVALIGIATVFTIKYVKKRKLENEKIQKRKDKEDEVEDLKLTVEKEKLKKELDSITAPKFIYCKYCRSKNDAGAKHCFKCGVGFDDK